MMVRSSGVDLFQVHERHQHCAQAFWEKCVCCSDGQVGRALALHLHPASTSQMKGMSQCNVA